MTSEYQKWSRRTLLYLYRKIFPWRRFVMGEWWRIVFNRRSAWGQSERVGHE